MLIATAGVLSPDPVAEFATRLVDDGAEVAFDMINAVGVETVWHRTACLARATREGCEALGMAVDLTVRLHGGSAQTHYILALLYVRQNQPELAVEDLRQAVTLDPTNLDRARREPYFANFPPDSPIGRFLNAAPPTP